MSAAPSTVPFLDVQAMHRELRPELARAALRVIDADQLVLGPEVAAFEAEWAVEVGAAEAVGVGSGMDALSMGLRALGVGPGDEVVVPAHTFIATWLAVLHVGAVPVPVDVSPATGRWDIGEIACAIGPRTRALLPVHLYGHPDDLDPILELARRHDLVVLDDAAQAHGARYRGRPLGGLCDATAWSFYPGKNLGALGDGGAVTADDPRTAERVRSLRNYGSSMKYRHEEIGYNSRLDELQAALLRVKLARMSEFTARRRRVADRYAQELADCGDHLVLPSSESWADPVWHLYVVRSPHRDQLQAHLAEQGVQTLVHYPTPPHRQPVFAGTPLAAVHLPGADAWAAQVLSLPMGPNVGSADQSRVVDAVRSFRP